MSFIRLFGVRSFWVALPLAVLEVIVFFALSVAYFVGPPALHKTLTGSAMSIWLWVAQALVYLLAVTIWWTPGQKASNDAELLALTMVLATGLIAGGIYIQTRYGIISELPSDFWRIVATKGGLA